jgi:hypothetical protein
MGLRACRLRRYSMKARRLPMKPLIKSHLQAVLVQSVFRHVLVSSSIEIAIEFSFVGIQGRRERAIGSNRTAGGSSRETVLAIVADSKPLPFHG